ncbi:DUF1835 domain-containing protein [Sporosarcina sp.]|uniref:DUF1835 domain-containing protein n=1 Tax=Sporosarcina sp. TaxID=49982 RepID=UPI00261043B5|nr:DUF1835 domain-containing protein [Sporosarcina sp.]
MENINKLKQEISKLDERDAKSILQLLLIRSEQCSEQELNETLRSVKESLLQTANKEVKTAETVHIIFGGSAGGSLKAAFRKKAYKNTEDIIVVPGVLSTGPVEALHTEKGVKNRVQWFRENNHSFFGDVEQEESDMRKALEQIKAVAPTQKVIIWTGENAAEQTGLRIAMYLLHNKPNDIYEMNTLQAFHELHVYVQPEKVYFYRTSGEMAPEQLLELYEHVELRPMRAVRRRALYKEGQNVLFTEDLLRTWEHDELWGSDSDRHDDFIIECAKRLHQEQGEHEFMKSARLIGEVIGHMEQYTGDQWIEFRVRELIVQGVFDYQGDLCEMRLYEVKLKEEFLQ